MTDTISFNYIIRFKINYHYTKNFLCLMQLKVKNSELKFHTSLYQNIINRKLRCDIDFL